MLFLRVRSVLIPSSRRSVAGSRERRGKCPVRRQSSGVGRADAVPVRVSAGVAAPVVSFDSRVPLIVVVASALCIEIG